MTSSPDSTPNLDITKNRDSRRRQKTAKPYFPKGLYFGRTHNIRTFATRQFMAINSPLLTSTQNLTEPPLRASPLTRHRSSTASHQTRSSCRKSLNLHQQAKLRKLSFPVSKGHSVYDASSLQNPALREQSTVSVVEPAATTQTRITSSHRLFRTYLRNRPPHHTPQTPPILNPFEFHAHLTDMHSTQSRIYAVRYRCYHFTPRRRCICGLACCLCR